MRLLQSLALIFTLITSTVTQSSAQQTPPPRATPPASAAQPDLQPSPSPTPFPPPTIKIDSYRAPSARILGAALTSDHAYARLAHLTDQIGNRLSGSQSLERAIEWALREMKKDGLDNVRAERVMVPHWVRGAESLEVTSPVSSHLALLGLGNSVGTPADGISAEAIVVRSFEELDTLGERVRGKMVVYNVPFTNYGATVQYRHNGASRAAQHGAVAALVRSVTPVSLQTPHTGAMSYAEGQPKIPTAAITIEGAELLQRLQDSGNNITLQLKMEANFSPTRSQPTSSPRSRVRRSPRRSW